MKFVEHTFGPSETIEAVIRKYNSHAMSREVSQIFMGFYNKKNGQVTPKVGDVAFIPVDDRIAGMQT